MSLKNLGFILETAVEKLKGTIDDVKIFFSCALEKYWDCVMEVEFYVRNTV